MKARHRRKLMQAKVRHYNLWNWSFDKLVTAVCVAYNKMNKALQETYKKSRHEQQA